MKKMMVLALLISPYVWGMEQNLEGQKEQGIEDTLLGIAENEEILQMLEQLNDEQDAVDDERAKDAAQWSLAKREQKLTKEQELEAKIQLRQRLISQISKSIETLGLELAESEVDERKASKEVDNLEKLYVQFQESSSIEIDESLSIPVRETLTDKKAVVDRQQTYIINLRKRVASIKLGLESQLALNAGEQSTLDTLRKEIATLEDQCIAIGKAKKGALGEASLALLEERQQERKDAEGAQGPEEPESQQGFVSRWCTIA